MAVDLIGAHLQVAGDAFLPRRFEQRLRADDLRDGEVAAVHDRAVHMRFGGEVQHAVAAAHRLADDLGIGDVAMHEAYSGDRASTDRRFSQIARIGQFIEHDDLVRVARERAAHEVAANESRATRHEQPLERPTHPYLPVQRPLSLTRRIPYRRSWRCIGDSGSQAPLPQPHTVIARDFDRDKPRQSRKIVVDGNACAWECRHAKNGARCRSATGQSRTRARRRASDD